MGSVTVCREAGLAPCPIPLTDVDACVFCWLVYVSVSFKDRDLGKTPGFLLKEMKAQEAGCHCRCVSSGPASQDATKPSSGPASQDSPGSPQAPPPRRPSGSPQRPLLLGASRGLLPGPAPRTIPGSSSRPPPRTPRGLPQARLPEALGSPEALLLRTSWGLLRPRPQGSLGSPWPRPLVCGLGWEVMALLGWKLRSSRWAGD